MDEGRMVWLSNVKAFDKPTIHAYQLSQMMKGTTVVKSSRGGSEKRGRK